MYLYMSINDEPNYKTGSQLNGKFSLTKYKEYNQWEYVNRDLRLNHGDVFYYWLNGSLQAADFYFISLIKKFTFLEDGSLFEPIEPVPTEMTYLDSLRDKNGNLFDDK